MSIYDALMTLLLLAAVVGMVINHRTGWLASRVARSPRTSTRDGSHLRSQRRLLDDDRGADLIRPTTPQD